MAILCQLKVEKKIGAIGVAEFINNSHNAYAFIAAAAATSYMWWHYAAR